MKLLTNILLASILAFAAASLPASSAHAIGRSPILQAHMQSTQGRWNRGGATSPYGHNGPPSNAATVPELDASSASSALALLLAVAMLGAGYRRKDEDGLALPG